jgi:alkylation response protein AidB-like acyl-CoA dehydrogenase
VRDGASNVDGAEVLLPDGGETPMRHVYSEDVARAVDAGEKNASMYSAMAKVFASDTAMKVTTDAVQVFGGYGYMKEYPVEKFFRDSKIGKIYEGTSNMQLQTIAKMLMSEYEKRA